MKKIATPQNLAAELRTLLAYAASPNPSRVKLASGLRDLAGAMVDPTKPPSKARLETTLRRLLNQGTSGVKRDPDWRSVNAIFKRLNDAGFSVQNMDTEYYRLPGSSNLNDGKRWTFEIPYTSRATGPSGHTGKGGWYVTITASFAGSAKDPSESYDITVNLNYSARAGSDHWATTLNQLAHRVAEGNTILVDGRPTFSFSSRSYGPGIAEAWVEGTAKESAEVRVFIKKMAKELTKLTGYDFTVSFGRTPSGVYSGPVSSNDVSWGGQAISPEQRVSIGLNLASQVAPADRHSHEFKPLVYTLGIVRGKYALMDNGYDQYSDATISLPNMPTMRHVKKLIDEVGLEKIITALGGPAVGKNTGPVTTQTVEQFIKDRGTYFDLDTKAEGSLSYSTRDSGDVGDETPGPQDVKHARELAKALRAEFGAKIKVTLEVVDEWVHLDVTIP